MGDGGRRRGGGEEGGGEKGNGGGVTTSTRVATPPLIVFGLNLWRSSCLSNGRLEGEEKHLTRPGLKRMRLTSQWRSASLGTGTEVPGVGGDGTYLITVELPLLSPE